MILDSCKMEIIHSKSVYLIGLLCGLNDIIHAKILIHGECPVKASYYKNLLYIVITIFTITAAAVLLLL